MTRGEAGPVFQPIVGAAAGELRGFEALPWRDSIESVIRESCDLTARCLALTGSLLPVSVNVAPGQLCAADFHKEVSRCLAEHGLPAAGLGLELAEDALREDRDRTCAALERLRALGICVRIDDFDCGPSALSHLDGLPASGIKLERGWLTLADDSAERRAIASAIVARAHHMEMDVVAAGIETASHFQRARDLGCDSAQGSGFSRPLSARQAVRYAQRQTALFAAG